MGKNGYFAVQMQKKGKSCKEVQNKKYERIGEAEAFITHKVNGQKIEIKAQESGETPQQALVREIMEELDTEIKVGELIDTIEFDYPTFHLSMDCFWAEVTKGHLELKEAEAAKWLRKDQLDSVAWLPADVTLIDKIRRYMK